MTERAVSAARAVPQTKAKRLYKSVSVVGDEGGFTVMLDAKPARTSGGMALRLASKPLADAVAAEWDAQRTEIDPAAMPLTRLVATAIERVAPQREAMIAVLISYADADLLCYRAAEPVTLKERQEKLWQPVLDWLSAKFGIYLTSSPGIMPATQAEAAVSKLLVEIRRLDDARLTAFQAAAGTTNSLSLALALIHGRLSAAEVSAAAHLDEVFQAEEWGEDEQALARRRDIAAEIEAISLYLSLLN